MPWLFDTTQNFRTIAVPGRTHDSASSSVSEAAAFAKQTRDACGSIVTAVRLSSMTQLSIFITVWSFVTRDLKDPCFFKAE